MKRVFALILAVVLVLGLAACGAQDPDPTPASVSAEEPEEAPAATPESIEATVLEGGTTPDELFVGTTESLGNLLPWTTGSECGAGFYLVYDMIFYYDTNDELASDIITDYAFSDDGYTLTLTMRDDIVFSNGDPATGEDLLFSLASTRDEDRQAVTTSFDYFDFDNSYVGDDGYTVVLKTYDTATMVSQFGNLALVCLLNKSWCEETGWTSQAWYDDPCGSGPYDVAEYLTDNYYIFERRADYWMDDADRNLPDRIRVTSYNEAATMYMDLENGAISIAIEPASEDFERSLDEGDNIEGKFINGNVCNWIVFDVENGPLSDINLRKAIAHGVMWDDVAAAGKGVKYTPATSTIPAYFPDYVEMGQYEYDPDYARECLAEAGYESGELTLMMYTGPQPGTIASATVLQAYLAEIGINLQFQSYEMATVVPMWMAGEGDISTFAMQGGTMALDSYWVYKELSSTATMADNRNITDTTYDELLAKALVAPTQEEAHQYYVELQQHIYDTYRVVSYFEEVNAVCFNTDIVSDVHFCSRTYPDLRFVVYA